VRSDYIDLALMEEIVRINLLNTLLLSVVVYLFFIRLPHWLFPQRHAGAGLEKTLSNILYMVAYVELLVPLLIFLKLFNLPLFIAIIGATKLLSIRLERRERVGSYLRHKIDRFLITLYDLIDDFEGSLSRFRHHLKERLYTFLIHFSITAFIKRVTTLTVFTYLIYLLGYRCFIAMANPLPDTSQFFEWVASMKNNILWADNKTAGADFYGISIFIFLLHTLTNIDTIVLFNIYPLLLITFLLLLCPQTDHPLLVRRPLHPPHLWSPPHRLPPQYPHRHRDSDDRPSNHHRVLRAEVLRYSP